MRAPAQEQKEQTEIVIDETEILWVIKAKPTSDKDRFELMKAMEWIATETNYGSDINDFDDGVWWYVNKQDGKRDAIEKLVREIRRTMAGPNMKEFFDEWMKEVEEAKREAVALEERKKRYLEGLLNGAPSESMEYPIRIDPERFARGSITFWAKEEEEDPFTAALIAQLRTLVPEFDWYHPVKKVLKGIERDAQPILTSYEWYDSGFELHRLNKIDFLKMLNANLHDEWKKKYLSNRAGKRELRRMLGLPSKEEKVG